MEFLMESEHRTNQQKTLLAEPDSLITICVREDEYMAEKVKTVKTHANYDDCVAHKTIVCKKMKGNLR